MTTFAERLRTLRRAAGLSQTELAGDGLSPSYISLLESGRRRPSPAVAAQLAAKLGCSTSQLLDGEPSEHERRVQLELAYAELSLRHDGSAEAVQRLTALVNESDLSPAEQTQALLLLAEAQERAGELRAAIGTLSPAFERARSQPDGYFLPRLAVQLCYCHWAAGDLTRAITVGEQALESCRSRGLNGTDEYFQLASTVMYAYADAGEESYAVTWADQLITEAEAAGSHGGRAAVYWNASLLAEREGRIDDALRLSRRALAHLGELGDSRDLARLKVASAGVLLAADPPQVEEAAQALARARDELRRLGSEVDMVEFDQLTSLVALHEDDPERAEDLARAATRRLPDDAGGEQLSLAHRALGDALAAQNREPEAFQHWTNAADLHAAAPKGRGAALLWRDLAERFRALGQTEPALQAYRAALDAAGVRDRTTTVLGVLTRLRARTAVPAADGASTGEAPAEQE
ncbi:MAG TPA: helix-turn-helix transcriptional regulator [Kineosporiaceae bacterium]|nr:helix-turn-helix transcriptional regulator [Kineosporiaceae bacterium]